MSTLRLPAHLKIDQRFLLSKTFVNNFNPKWISLQFVPFSFHHKGLMFGLAKRFLSLSDGRKLHVMFHELWIGVYGKFSTKQRLLGKVQKLSILGLLKRLKPDLITTTIEIYRRNLSTYNVNLLPLFGNIAIQVMDSESGLVYDNNRFTAIHFGTFSSEIHDFERQIHFLSKAAKKVNKIPFLKVAGSGGVHKEKAMSIAKEILGDEQVQDLGRLTEALVSIHLLTSDLGISRADPVLLGKSGSAIAMLEHGLPLLLRGGRPAGQEYLPISFKERLVFFNDEPPEKWTKDVPGSLIKEVSTLYYKMIN